MKKMKIEDEQEPNIDQFIDYSNKQGQSDISKVDKNLKSERSKST